MTHQNKLNLELREHNGDSQEDKTIFYHVQKKGEKEEEKYKTKRWICKDKTIIFPTELPCVAENTIMSPLELSNMTREVGTKKKKKKNIMRETL